MAWCDEVKEPRLLISPVPVASKEEGCIVSLCHPKSGEATSYVLTDGQLHELNWFKQPYGSWFLGDYVCEDGSLYICTPIDPIFILLPIFDAARMQKDNHQGVFRQLDEILFVHGYPGYQQLMSIAQDHMQVVCEVKEIGSTKFFRLDDSKVLTWLCCKVQHLKEAFPRLGKNYAAQEERDILKGTVLILGEYLKDDRWLMLLFRLDAQEVFNSSEVGAASVFLENTPVSVSPLEGNMGNENISSSKGKKSKKLKTKVDSQNIKDMFRRATRR
ncbi:uncharacterized protein [Typha angustifolia]|uniref:uncharacterized protein isoform X2 n=1 Tax=Typha angustifolia TaxID=59011 RepID=UPI003C2D9CBC